jgi:hypothetical protein
MSIKSLEDLLREASIQEVEERKNKISREDRLYDWFHGAAPGNTYIYFIGDALTSQIKEVWRLKQIVWQWAVDGKVILLRRRIQPYVIQYIVQKPEWPPLSKRLIPDDYKSRIS